MNFFENYGLLFRGDCRETSLYFCEEKFAKTQEYKDGWDAVRAGETVTAEFQRVKKMEI